MDRGGERAVRTCDQKGGVGRESRLSTARASARTVSDGRSSGAVGVRCGVCVVRPGFYHPAGFDSDEVCRSGTIYCCSVLVCSIVAGAL